MKLLRRITPKTKQVDTREPLGHGFDAAVVVAIFFGVGWGIDAIAGTRPLFMILMTLFGAVGVFLRFWYQYDARMTVLEEQRRAKAVSRTTPRAAATATTAPTTNVDGTKGRP